MGDEPMDEDDSFYKPVPCSVPYKKPFSSQPPPENKDSDPDSDDSFEAFAPTQSTAGSTGSAPSAGSKGSMPPPVATRPFSNKPFQSMATGTQKNVFKPSLPSTSGVPFSQQSTQQIGVPFVSTQTTPRPVVPFQPQNRTAVHPGIKHARDSEITQRTSSTSSTAPSSPNSLARHRSANSGLRNSPANTPPCRTGASIFITKTTSPEVRSSTPSGEVKMLRDQLDHEKQRSLKLQTDFQKDTQKNLLHHKKEISDKDELIRKQEKEIEMLKMSSACRKPESISMVKTVNVVNPLLPLNPDVKKVYPKIPAEFSNTRRTPRRTANFPTQPISAFRHLKDEDDDDTFQMDVSFRPNATSTPKISALPRVGIRRPLDLEAEDAANGAPTPKRIPVFQPERRQRNREELDEELREIWSKIDGGEPISNMFFGEKEEKETPNEDQLDMEDGEENEWIDNYLCRQLKSVEFRKTLDRITNTKTKSKKQKPESKVAKKNNCGRCKIDERMTKEEMVAGCSEKEWEKVEAERMDRERRTAEELRSLQYSNLLQAVSRRGVEEFEGAGDRRKQAEEDYEKRMKEVRKRPLDELRAEKKEAWRSEMMRRLREEGELEAVLEVPEVERNADCIWTSDSEDENWMFPKPYDLNKNELCSDCAQRQRIMRRVSKREREKRKLKEECLHEYGIEQREMLRNMSILTKSKMEAADNELNRHVDEIMASRLFDDEDDDDDDIF